MMFSARNTQVEMKEYGYGPKLRKGAAKHDVDARRFVPASTEVLHGRPICADADAAHREQHQSRAHPSRTRWAAAVPAWR